MPASARRITPDDILPLAEYAKQRAARRRALLPVKKRRRIEVGPFATFYFENFDTMLQQVQEMLYIEKGGDAQLADELDAYNPLIPQGNELVATVMFEIDDEARRRRVLARLGGIERHAFLDVNGEKIYGEPEGDIERTSAEGKASSVHFLHFRLSDQQAAAFRKADSQVMLGFDHDHYAHLAVLSPASRAALAEDLD
ncbi:MAG: DUF3501 family protein [Alphaproteobacteria bacterium]|nr:MAG: DUF3501 family protein [Alphaproteobacteria bacterium]